MSERGGRAAEGPLAAGPGGGIGPGDEEHDQEGGAEALGGRAASGVLWLLAQKWAARLSGFVTLLVLTRKITPPEFGVVAAAMTVIPIIYLLADLGFSTYLLQADSAGPRTLDTGFWTSALAGALLSVGLFTAAPMLAGTLGVPRVASVLRVLVLAVVPTVTGAVPAALLRRRMDFRAVAVRDVAAAVVAQVVAVVAAVLGAGVWALVAQVVVSQWVSALLTWRRARWVPSLRVSLREFRVMTAFGVRVSAVDLVAMTRAWLETWIVLAGLGTTALGLLSIAQRLVQIVQDLTAASLAPVSVVTFARVREVPERLRSTYLKALGAGYAVVSPFMVLVVAGAPVLVPMVFGNNWTGSAPIAQALAVAGIVTLGAMLDHGLFLGVGRPGTWLAYAVVVDAATVSATLIAVRWGLPAVALSFVVVAVLATAARWVIVGRLLQLSVGAMSRPFVRVVCPMALSAVLGTAVLHRLLVPGGQLVALAVSSTLTVLCCIVLLRVSAADVIEDVLAVVPVPARLRRLVGRLVMLPDPLSLAAASPGAEPLATRSGAGRPVGRGLLTETVLRLRARQPPLPPVGRALARRFVSRMIPHEAAVPVEGWDKPLVPGLGTGIDPPAEPVSPSQPPRSAALVTERGIRCQLVTQVLDIGGLDEFVAFLARRLPAFGLSTSVVVTRPGGGRLAEALRGEGIPVRELWDQAEFDGVLHAARPDVISAHAPADWTLRSAVRLGIPLVETLHGLPTPVGTDWSRERARSRSVTAFVAVSESVRRQYLRGNPHFPPHGVLVIPNGFDEVHRASVDRERSRAWLGIGEEFLFVSMARICLQKNAYGLVDAFSEVARLRDECHLLLAGRVEDNWYVAQIGRLLAAMPRSLRMRVHLRESTPHVPAVLAAADCFVMNSFFEGWSLASMEALAAGLPVVMSDVGGALEQVGEEGARGFVVANALGDRERASWAMASRVSAVRQANHQAFVDAMVTVVAQREHWRAVRAALAAESGTRFDSATCVMSHAAVLRRAVSARDAAGFKGFVPTA